MSQFLIPLILTVEAETYDEAWHEGKNVAAGISEENIYALHVSGQVPFLIGASVENGMRAIGTVNPETL